ncbi:SRPBCC family protein [uncultured Jatrophihabitans sp.]|uniref:SRPBCC family protein n=1 Tax=uncultured Jatrophihabitans sp. TaxID=1610747 RepID=UPI0035C9BF4B
MPEQSTQSITIDADPGQIMAVIADFENYPEWTGSVKKAEIIEGAAVGTGGRARRVAFTLDAGIVRDQYELVYVWTGDTLVEWDLTSGQMMRAQHGSYALRADGPERTHVTYSLSVDLAIPMLGLLKRKAERVVMDTALKELKKRVESLRDGT